MDLEHATRTTHLMLIGAGGSRLIVFGQMAIDSRR
jgi:hypothetical protein